MPIYKIYGVEERQNHLTTLTVRASTLAQAEAYGERKGLRIDRVRLVEGTEKSRMQDLRDEPFVCDVCGHAIDGLVVQDQRIQCPDCGGFTQVFGCGAVRRAVEKSSPLSLSIISVGWYFAAVAVVLPPLAFAALAIGLYRLRSGRDQGAVRLTAVAGVEIVAIAAVVYLI